MSSTWPPIIGPIAYLAIYGHLSAVTRPSPLSLITALKLGFVACLVLAHQRFLQNKGLVLIVLTSLLANLIISFLHNFVPIPLVSITDAIGAIVVAILAVIWAIILFIFAIISIIKAVH
jgi:VanZ family protein